VRVNASWTDLAIAARVGALADADALSALGARRVPYTGPHTTVSAW